jgi:leucyl-tRNA synthetase
MAATSVSKALEELALSKTKELKGVRDHSNIFHTSPYFIDLRQTEKRDSLIAIEKKYQQKWEEDGVFESNAPSNADIPLHSISAAELRQRHPKFFGTM